MNTHYVTKSNDEPHNRLIDKNTTAQMYDTQCKISRVEGKISPRGQIIVDTLMHRD